MLSELTKNQGLPITFMSNAKAHVICTTGVHVYIYIYKCLNVFFPLPVRGK